MPIKQVLIDLGMNDLINTIVYCVVILIAFIIISLKLPHKLSIIKYLLWFLSFCIVIFVFVITPLNVYNDRQESKYLIGTYKLDINNSRYRHKNLSNFSSIVLTVKDDQTFTINKDAPFFKQNTGTWSYWMDGDKEIIKYKFKDAADAYIVLRTDSEFVFKSDMLVNSDLGDKIVFKADKLSNEIPRP